MSTYYNISIDEMRGVLKADKGWKEGKTGEEISFEYSLVCAPEIVIKVCTGIKSNSGASRAVGKDAIRVFAFNSAKNIGWIKTTRVYRVQGWEANLKAKVMSVINQAKARLNPPKM